MVEMEAQEALEKGIFYDRRVVTYKWLTCKLDVHPNVAKQCLQRFVSEQESDNTNIAGQSVVTGVKDKVLRVILTAHSSVAEAKKRMSSVTSVHLYSACPANLEALEEKLTEAATESNRLDFGPRCFPVKCEAAGRSVHRKQKKHAEVKHCDSEVTPPPQPAALVTKGSETNGTLKTSHPTKKGEERKKKADARPTKPSKTKGKQGNVASMFNAKAADNAAKNVSKQSPPEPPKPVMRENTPERVAEQKPLPASPESPVQKKRRSKKRKALSDSEPSEDESILTPPSSLTVPSSAGNKSSTDGVDSGPSRAEGSVEKGKKRRRVLKPVQETYKDEDGFLVTRTVKQLVSESDDDEEPLPKVAKGQEQQKGNDEGKKGTRSEMKQQTLFSFLRKK